jgi:hypothetical protein
VSRIVSDPNADLSLDLLASVSEETSQYAPKISRSQPPSTPEPEPGPMIDIHDAHHAASTWRDFFIHIATIVLGLFVAVALEQTIVYFEQQHQRHELIEDVQTEASHNLSILEADVNSALIVERWDRAVLDTLRSVKPENGALTVILPPRPDYSVRRSASRAVWTVAHTNGKAALVPEDIAEAFDRCDYAASVTYKALEDIYAADSESMAVEAKLGVKLDPGATLRLSAVDRDDLAASVTHSMAANADFLYTATSWAAVADAVSHQVQTRESMTAYVTQHRAALAKARLQ